MLDSGFSFLFTTPEAKRERLTVGKDQGIPHNRGDITTEWKDKNLSNGEEKHEKVWFIWGTVTKCSCRVRCAGETETQLEEGYKGGKGFGQRTFSLYLYKVEILWKS